MSDIWGEASGTNDPYISNTDLRMAMHTTIFGSATFIGQGRPFVLRELTNTVCTACWSKNDGNSSVSNCIYCDGEGYQFTERVITAILTAGIAPVYKAGVFGTGQYPEAAYGATDPTKATIYCEWNIFPNYEKYTLPSFDEPDKMFEIKVDPNGRPMYDPTSRQPIRIGKWKLLSVTPLFGDYGRVEYFELSCEKSIIS
jgi:hypothetical protein